jgi:hypothetical protein
MQKRQIWIVVCCLLACAAFVAFQVTRVSAHEGREVGEYELHFGWQNEPAIAGVNNGPEIFIHKHGATEEDEIPVEGAEKTLKLKVTFGGQSKELELEPAWQDPGHYVAHLTPTRPGDYTFELTGVISPTALVTDTAAITSTAAMTGTEAISPTVVNETFTSADGEFSSVEPASDVLFPDSKLDMVSLQAQLNAQMKEIEALKKDLEALKAAKK